MLPSELCRNTFSSLWAQSTKVSCDLVCTWSKFCFHLNATPWLLSSWPQVFLYRNKYWCGTYLYKQPPLSTLICLLIIGHCPLSPFLLISINFAPHWMLHLDWYLLGHKCFCIGSSKHCRHNGFFWDRSSNRLYSCLCIMPDQLTKHCLEFFESRANNPDASAFYFPIKDLWSKWTE